MFFFFLVTIYKFTVKFCMFKIVRILSKSYLVYQMIFGLYQHSSQSYLLKFSVFFGSWVIFYILLIESVPSRSFNYFSIWQENFMQSLQRIPSAVLCIFFLSYHFLLFQKKVIQNLDTNQNIFVDTCFLTSKIPELC